MEYTIKEISNICGLTKRTLRFYDEINLLKPSKINSSGYRIYSQKEIDKLYQILIYKNLEFSLDDIKRILTDPNFNEIDALREHQKKIIKKKEYFDLIIANIENVILSKKGIIKMDNEEKFKIFKENIINENEEKYGDEIRKKYGSKNVELSNNKILNMSLDDYEIFKNLSEDILANLDVAFLSNDPKSEKAQYVAKLHKKWIEMSWGYYNDEAHKNLVEMYILDERFSAYYDRNVEGKAIFLRNAVIFMIDGV